jgi:hypothetical protein
MDLRHRTWVATVQLAVVVSVVAVLVAVAATWLGDVPQAAIVVPVMIVAFVASWIRTGRVRRESSTDVVLLGARAERLA